MQIYKPLYSFFIFIYLRNVIPTLITQTPTPTPFVAYLPPSNQKREKSFDQKVSVRIKSAHPLNLDREKLMQEKYKEWNEMKIDVMDQDTIRLREEISMQYKALNEILD